MTITISNRQIYNIFLSLESIPLEKITPRIAFPILKNKKIFQELILEIETFRLQILQQYGIYSEEEKKYIIPKKFQNVVDQKLKELADIEQDINILSLDPIDLNSFPISQIETLSFMIKKEE